MHEKSHEPLHTGTPLVGALQVAPHLPQFAGSVCTFTHEPLQLVFVPHAIVHLPALHTLPAPHAVMQFPQCRASD